MKISLPFLLACVLFLSSHIASGQEGQRDPGPKTELLTMNGSKPSLSQTGEGITSYKIGDLYQRGSMQITLVKTAEAPFKIELPIGYTLFNDLIYSVETNAVFTGPTDITFSLPSANTKEAFAQLRILYATHDHADPEVPRWIDATAEEAFIGHGRWPSEADIRQRFRDFNTRTLHAITPEDEPRVIVVALKDFSKSRERLTADLAISGTGPAQVTEGRSVTYELQITNKGPDAASALSLHAQPGFTFASVDVSVGKCRMSAQNVYCKFPSLEKGRTIDVKIVETCPWRTNLPAGLPGHDQPTATVGKSIMIGATEQDPVGENNQLYLMTEVFPDPNKGPEIELLSPTLFQIFPGPAATVPIRFKASDPDGFIKKLELYTHTLKSVEPLLLGEPTMRSEGEYELIYKDAPFGRNWVTIVATDNLGRVTTSDSPEFFVNGTAKVQITNPKAGSKLNLADGEFTVTIHATHPSSRLKKVSLSSSDSEAIAIGNDDYAVKLRYCSRRCALQAIVIDENGVETYSDPLVFTMMEPPKADLRWFDGEYSRDFEPGKPFMVNRLVLLPLARHEMAFEAKIAKLEVFANGKRICTEDSPMGGFGGECVWKPSPGKHKLQTVATDEDGAVGKSAVIEVIIERP